jgi:ribonuclease HI
METRESTLATQGSQTPKKVKIYTDGSCDDNKKGNNNRGGWAAVLIYKDTVKEIYGSETATTNNRMEILSCIKALQALKAGCDVELHSDSAYVVNCFLQKWYVTWQNNGWINSRGKPVENQDLWEQLLLLTKNHNVTFVKVKGHADDHYNNRCDVLAKQAC